MLIRKIVNRKSVVMGAMVPLLALASCEQAGKKQVRVAPPAQATAPTIAQQAPPPPPPPAKVEAPKPDAAAELIARAESEYQQGQENYSAGHLTAAKQNFDAAVTMLLTSKIPLKSDDRLMNEFDKIVEHVNQLEMVALQQGDGFTEQKPVPAPIAEENELTFPVDPAIKKKAETSLKVTTSDLPLVINDYVASFISFFMTPRGHAVIERALTRAGRYRSMIERTLREEGVPQDVIYLAQAESGFQPTALNPSGARGMWQLMASRGAEYGLQRNWWIDERQDPEKSTRAAARHLHDLYKQFGDWYLAMAAYDSGPGNVQYAVEKTGYADFWELYRRNVLPGETKNYVPIILAMTIMAKNPQQYGLTDVVPELPLETDTVRVDYPVDLRLVAEAVDIPLQQLMELNPSLLRMTTPNGSSFDLHLPPGTKDKFIAAMNEIPVDKRVSWRFHNVAQGETLTEIARKYHTTTAAIAEANNIDADDELRATKLIIPISASRAAAAVQYSRRATRYHVRKGDTVLSVADDFGVPAERVRRWNHIKGNALHAGTTIAIYRPVEVAESAARPRSRRTAVRHKTSGGAARRSAKANRPEGSSGSHARGKIKAKHSSATAANKRKTAHR